MSKSLLALAAAAATLLSAPVHALSTGDVAFTSFNADEDGWSLVTFVDIAANTTIHFSDNEWNGSAFNTGEGQWTWNSGAAVISAGTVVRFSSTDAAGRAASVGSFSGSGDTGTSATNETIYAFLGSSNSPSVFLAGVSSEGTSNLGPAGLTAGQSAVVLTNSTDYAAYAGPRSGLASFADYRTLVNDAANWTILVGGSQENQVPGLAAFTVTAVPEPGTYALLLCGLGLVGAAARRRRG
ncbi:MAG: PEPxxWA-CTERM sorting domain-containing protein [Burkholderiaceae bacterium]|nr:PEPxxWA-CTERM sorting domain-containing protein [Burkholderiaceae bacterium]